MPPPFPCHLSLPYPPPPVPGAAVLLSAESSTKLFPEAQLNEMHNFLPSTTQRKQQNNHMCLTLLPIDEPMPSRPFCAITATVPQEEWKELWTATGQSAELYSFGGNRLLQGLSWQALGFVFQTFVFLNFKDKSSSLTYSNEQRCFNKSGHVSSCLLVKSDNEPFGFNSSSIGAFNRKHILC